MARVGDLISSMRSGGGAGVQAAREFLQLAQGGGVSRAQVREAQQIVNTPGLGDQFAGMAAEFSALLAGGGEGVFRDVQALAPDRKQLKDPKAIPERFAGDLTMVEHQLLQHPGLTRAQKAERLFQFFEAYAERFHELTHGTAQQQQAATAGEAFQSPLNAAELQKAMVNFDKALTRAGFQHLVASDGRTGTQRRCSRRSRCPSCRTRGRSRSMRRRGRTTRRCRSRRRARSRSCRSRRG
ncbi:MAG: hypothetical protein U0228_00705 [Myxococcaceae bacterium]